MESKGNEKVCIDELPTDDQELAKGLKDLAPWASWSQIIQAIPKLKEMQPDQFEQTPYLLQDLPTHPSNDTSHRRSGSSHPATGPRKHSVWLNKRIKRPELLAQARSTILENQCRNVFKDEELNKSEQLTEVPVTSSRNRDADAPVQTKDCSESELTKTQDSLQITSECNNNENLQTNLETKSQYKSASRARSESSVSVVSHQELLEGTRMLPEATILTNKGRVSKARSSSSREPKSEAVKAGRAAARKEARKNRSALSFQNWRAARQERMFEKTRTKKLSYDARRYSPAVLVSQRSLTGVMNNSTGSVDRNISPQSGAVTVDDTTRRNSLSSLVDVTSTSALEDHCPPHRNLSRLRDALWHTSNPKTRTNHLNTITGEDETVTSSMKSDVEAKQSDKILINDQLKDDSNFECSKEILSSPTSKRRREDSDTTSSRVSESRDSSRAETSSLSSEQQNYSRSPRLRQGWGNRGSKQMEKFSGRNTVSPVIQRFTSPERNSHKYSSNNSLARQNYSGRKTDKSGHWKRNTNCPSLMSIDTAEVRLQSRRSIDYDHCWDATRNIARFVEYDRPIEISEDEEGIIGHQRYRHSSRHRDESLNSDVICDRSRDSIEPSCPSDNGIKSIIPLRENIVYQPNEAKKTKKTVYYLHPTGRIRRRFVR